MGGPSLGEIKMEAIEYFKYSDYERGELDFAPPLGPSEGNM